MSLALSLQAGKECSSRCTHQLSHLPVRSRHVIGPFGAPVWAQPARFADARRTSEKGALSAARPEETVSLVEPFRV